MPPSPPSKLHCPPSRRRPPLLPSPPSTPLLPPAPARTIYSDRFIPSRSGSNFALFDLPPTTPASSSGSTPPFGAAYESLLRSVLLGENGGGISSPSTPSTSYSPSPSRIYRFKYEMPRKRSLVFDGVFGEDAFGDVGRRRPKTPRVIPTSPYKVLDAPELQGDFYMNLVDWSSQDLVAVGLASCIYLWNAPTNKVTQLCDIGDDDIACSVGWSRSGSYLAIGTSLGKLQVWDVSQSRKVRTMKGHNQHIGALSWSSQIFSSGSRDRTIFHHDIRVKDDSVSKLVGHNSEVCGLKWSPDDSKLASGGNDNRLLIWNQHSNRPILKYTKHTAAVKAVAWSPHLHGVLASGGGTADQCIHFWNTTTNLHLNCVDTRSQVCNLAWSNNVDELVSTHGYSENEIIIWKYPTMSKVATLTGHTDRVLYLAASPDGKKIVTGAGDETLRFWDVFPPRKSQNPGREFGWASLGRCHIR